MSKTARIADNDKTTELKEGTGWTRAFADLSREHGFEPLRVTGTIPDDLKGALYRVGPAVLTRFGKPYGHWFDADGAVTAVEFAGGNATGAVRVVQTPAVVQEREAGKPLYGSYGTLTPGGWLSRLRPRLKNAANTNAMVWQKRLFALYDTGLPVEIDPGSLTTLGETDLDGAVPQYFCAHPHRTPQRNAIYCVGVRPGIRSELDVFELPDKGPARRLTTIALKGVPVIHDAIATPNYLVVFHAPFEMKLGTALGKLSVSDGLVFNPRKETEIIVFPFDDIHHPHHFRAEPFFMWHFCNAFDDALDQIVVDFVRHNDFSTNEYLNQHYRDKKLTLKADGIFVRAHLSLREMRMRWEPLGDFRCEFPRVSPRLEAREYRYAYMASELVDHKPPRPYQSMTKLDVTSGKAWSFTFEGEQYPSEPIFVPRPERVAMEDDGYLLTLVYDAPSHTSHVAILDAQKLEAGPIARAHFDHHIPLTYHGAWMPK